MGMLAPAVPWIAKGAALIGGGIFGKKMQDSAMKRSPEEAAALTGAQGTANTLMGTGRDLVTGGTDRLGEAGNYWSTLLRGNRAQMAQATAAPRAAITDQYRGAELGLERSGVRGAQKDLALAELTRDKAAKIAGLTTGVQPAAAAATADIGSTLLGTGAPMLGQAGGIWNNLLAGGFENRKYGRAEGEKGSKAIGGLIFDILKGTLGKKFPGTGWGDAGA